MDLSLIQIRPLEKKDNAAIATIIRNALTEFGANKPGTVFFDPTTDNLYQLFKTPGSFYQVAVFNNEVIGGGGIFPTPGLPQGTCELVKMYLKPEVRNIGLGKKLMNDCLLLAKVFGYKNVYLESMPELKKAISAYEKLGFTYLDGPLGETGHFGCDLWMIKTLVD
jgi:putative acetyltransferase